MKQPLIIDLPYPTLEGIEKNSYYAKIILPLYVSSHGEIQAILSYFYYSLYFENFYDKKIAKTIKEISIAEMLHLEILGNLLIVLGHDPVFNVDTPFGLEYYKTSSFVYSKTPQKMLLDSISGELVAIGDYIKAIGKIEDENVSAVLQRIRLDEELHVKVLKELLTIEQSKSKK